MSYTIPNAASKFGPSLTVELDTPFIAWTGPDSQIQIAGVLYNASTNTISAPKTFTLAAKSAFAPSLASMDNSIYMAWVSTDRASVYVSELNFLGYAFSESISLSPHTKEQIMLPGGHTCIGAPSLYIDHAGFDRYNRAQYVKRIGITAYDENNHTNTMMLYSAGANDDQFSPLDIIFESGATAMGSTNSAPASCEGGVIGWTDMRSNRICVGQVVELAYSGSDSIPTIAEPVTLNYQSSASPAMLQVAGIDNLYQTEATAICYVEHRSNELKLTYYPAPGGIQPLPLKVTSKHTPAICHLKGHILTAWTGTGSDNSINLMVAQ